MRRVVFSLFVTAVLLSVPAVARADVAEEVIAITKAQWAAQMEQDIDKMNEHVAEEYTEFNPRAPIRLDGKKMNSRLFEPFLNSSRKVVAAEMANPKVQVYGDVAILTYNAVTVIQYKDGAVGIDNAKSTRVYVKMDGKWMLVHANFAKVH